MEQDASRHDELVDAALDSGRALGAAAVFFHARVAEVLGLGPSDTKVLDAVRENGQVTPKRLGELVGLAPASITGVLDRLEERGLVERAEHPSDGRRILIRVADGLAERLWPLYAPLSNGLKGVFQARTVEELQVLVTVFEQIAALQNRLAADLEAPTT